MSDPEIFASNLFTYDNIIVGGGCYCYTLCKMIDGGAEHDQITFDLADYTYHAETSSGAERAKFNISEWFEANATLLRRAILTQSN